MALYIAVFPLLGFILLVCGLGRLPKAIVAFIGVGSIAISAILVAIVAYSFLQQTSPDAYSTVVYTWLNVAGFTPKVSFYIDGLTLVMLSVITGVGLLIHIYSALFMLDDESYSRFFCYMNLFVFAMLILVMADNLLLLFVGWEGVGLCSYLLVGFWQQDSANGAAARKAFIVTRIGDTAMILGLLLLFSELGTLDIQAMMLQAQQQWSTGHSMATLSCLLLVGGAVGKSAQLPLQTWLPDAMAGPTPVSALIHAATMVTAGVYLIARTHDLFLLSPLALFVVAVIGAITLLMAAFSAITQTDIKRILAYSTISQIGYMFLALGVGAWSASIFHLMTHAFFKALLFLAAGAVIYSLHHEHNIYRMGGLRKQLPLAFWSFIIGSAALAALPLTSGFYSKDAILLAAYDYNPWFWVAGLVGALLTAIYSFRLVFVVFFGEPKTPATAPADWAMAYPLVVLSGLALVGGWFKLPLAAVFDVDQSVDHDGIIAWITPAVPIIGVYLAYLIFLRKTLDVSYFVNSKLGTALQNFWFHHWRLDGFYRWLLVRPYEFIAAINKNDVVDSVYRLIATITWYVHELSSSSQTGQLRTYAVVMVVGLAFTTAIFLGLISS